MALGSRDSNRAQWLSALLFLSVAACGDGAELGGFGEASDLFAGTTQHSASRARNVGSAEDLSVTETSESASETADAEPTLEPPVAGDDVPEPKDEATESSGESVPSGAEHDAGVAVSEPTATPAATQEDAGASEADASPSEAAGATDADAGATAADAGAPLIDIQIVAVTEVLHGGELARSAQVSGLLRSDAVRAFASETQAVYEAAQARQAALLLKKRFTPKANYASVALRGSADAALATLRTACGGDADTAYLDAQLAMAERELAVVEGVLIRDVCDGDLKLELNALRDQLKVQLTRARTLKSGL